MVAEAIISAAANLFGGALQDKGVRAANKQNLKIAREQMAFQERMSSTAYQRAAKDLSSAGLNRILALGSPASSPSGALATMQSETAGKADALKKGTASALQARIANQQFKALQAETVSKTQQAGLINQQRLKSVEDTAVTALQKQLLEKTLKGTQTVDPALEAIAEFIPNLPNIGSRLGKSLEQGNRTGWVHPNIKESVNQALKKWRENSRKTRRYHSKRRWNPDAVR